MMGAGFECDISRRASRGIASLRQSNRLGMRTATILGKATSENPALGRNHDTADCGIGRNPAQPALRKSQGVLHMPGVRHEWSALGVQDHLTGQCNSDTSRFLRRANPGGLPLATALGPTLRQDR